MNLDRALAYATMFLGVSVATFGVWSNHHMEILAHEPGVLNMPDHNYLSDQSYAAPARISLFVQEGGMVHHEIGVARDGSAISFEWLNGVALLKAKVNTSATTGEVIFDVADHDGKLAYTIVMSKNAGGATWTISPTGGAVAATASAAGDAPLDFVSQKGQLLAIVQRNATGQWAVDIEPRNGSPVADAVFALVAGYRQASEIRQNNKP